MAINGASMQPDATTYVAPSGGSGVAISSGFSHVANKVVAHFDDQTEFLTRTIIEFSSKKPTALVSAPGGYSQQRQSVFVKVPLTLANGNRTIITAGSFISRDVEMEAADHMALRLLLCQLTGQAAFNGFWDGGNQN